jgi:hypothetical protein
VAKLADRLERIARQTEAIAKEFVSIGDRVLSSISMTATIMVTALGYGAKRAPQEANIGGYATVNAAHSNRLQVFLHRRDRYDSLMGLPEVLPRLFRLDGARLQ